MDNGDKCNIHGGKIKRRKNLNKWRTDKNSDLGNVIPNDRKLYKNTNETLTINKNHKRKITSVEMAFLSKIFGKLNWKISDK